MDNMGNIGGAGGNFPLGGPTFLVSAADHRDAGTRTDSPGMLSGPVASTTALYGVATSGNLMRISLGPLGLPDAGTEGGPGLATGEQQLVLGGGGHLYAAGVSGIPGVSKLIRVAQVRTADLSNEWSGELASGQMTTAQVASPALDVYRLPNGAKDCTRTLGVLYVATALGSTATLYSISTPQLRGQGSNETTRTAPTSHCQSTLGPVPDAC